MPYFEGPNTALCTPIKKMLPNSIGRFLSVNAASANIITKISNTFTPMVMVRLLKRSARKPPAIENNINGRAKSAPTTGTNWSRFSGGNPMPMMMKITRLLSALSLNAP